MLCFFVVSKNLTDIFNIQTLVLIEKLLNIFLNFKDIKKYHILVIPRLVNLNIINVILQKFGLWYKSHFLIQVFFFVPHI